MLQMGYLHIDKQGRIWRCAYESHGRWIRTSPKRAENEGNKGYLRVTLQVNGRLASIQAHRLVWAWVNGRTIPPEAQINHIDLNKANNSPRNLELCTPDENIQHSYRNGRKRPWSEASEWRSGVPRVTAATVQEILAERRAGTILRVLAEKFGLSIAHVHRICSGDTGGKRERGGLS